MWLATRYGFYSVVCAHDDLLQDRSHPSLMMIRARKHDHLAKLRELHPELPGIKESAGTDYPYRIIANRDMVMAVVRGLVDEIDYTNFKNAAHEELPEDGAYISFLHSVWGLGLRITPPRVRKGGPTVE